MNKLSRALKANVMNYNAKLLDSKSSHINCVVLTKDTISFWKMKLNIRWSYITI